jgi:hypothetical protein
MKLTICKNNIFVYSVSGKIAEERIKDKLNKLLPRMWLVAWHKLKKDGIVYVDDYKFVWED